MNSNTENVNICWLHLGRELMCSCCMASIRVLWEWLYTGFNWRRYWYAVCNMQRSNTDCSTMKQHRHCMGIIYKNNQLSGLQTKSSARKDHTQLVHAVGEPSMGTLERRRQRSGVRPKLHNRKCSDSSAFAMKWGTDDASTGAVCAEVGWCRSVRYLCVDKDEKIPVI